MAEQWTDEHGRPDPPMEGDEAETLIGFLEYQRGTFAWKTQGLDDDQLKVTRPPSSMTLGGMIKHLAVVEDYWFAEVVGDSAKLEPWASVDWQSDPDWEWRTAADDSADELRAMWTAAVERSRSVVARAREKGGDAAALAAVHSAWSGRGQVSLRWVLTHMVEEYARHNGHADLFRESIDGETGE